MPKIALTWHGAWADPFVTIGDQIAMENLSRALTEAGIEHLVLSAFPTSLPVPVVTDFRQVPQLDLIVHVCGPLVPSAQLFFLLGKARKKLAVGVSVLGRFGPFNSLFDAIVARDGREPEHFDLAPALLPAAKKKLLNETPVVGLCLVGRQGEYKQGTLHRRAEELLTAATVEIGAAVTPISTVLREESAALEKFSAVDVVATTRMHGSLFALMYGKPVVAIDQVPGGAKVTSILRRVTWPLVFPAATATREQIVDALKSAIAGNYGAQIEHSRLKAMKLSRDAVAASVEAVRQIMPKQNTAWNLKGN